MQHWQGHPTGGLSSLAGKELLTYEGGFGCNATAATRGQPWLGQGQLEGDAGCLCLEIRDLLFLLTLIELTERATLAGSYHHQRLSPRGCMAVPWALAGKETLQRTWRGKNKLLRMWLLRTLPNIQQVHIIST